MKRRILAFVMFGLLLTIAGVVLAQEDLQKTPSCKYCGMDRTKFAHSRMLVTYDDGTTVATCSIHCLAVDLALHIDKTPVSIQVGDYTSSKLIDAEKAFWVIDGDKPGVMSRQAKWAFGKKENAEGFIREHGGKLATVDDAFRATYESMYADTKMIRERRKLKRMEMSKPSVGSVN